MFSVPPTPKQTRKFSTAATAIAIPEKWSDFAPLLEIASAGKFVQFNPYPCQVEISDIIDRSPYTAILKSRQLGCSEVVISKLLQWALLRPGFVGVVISKSILDSYKLSRRVQTMMKPLRLATDNKAASEIRFVNGSRLVFCQPGDSAAVGEPSVSAIVIDEFSLLKAAEQTLAAAVPSTAMMGSALRLILIFTPRSKNHYSFKLLNESNPGSIDLLKTIERVRSGIYKPLHHWQDLDGWTKILWHWRSHPVYCDRPDFLKNISKQQKLSWKKTLREFDLSFESTELQWLPDELIEQCATGSYEPPSPDDRYFAGLDTSSVGDDYFCFAILKIDRGILSLVSLYRHRRRSMSRHLARISALCKEYSIEAASVETNSFGQLYFEKLSLENFQTKWNRWTASAGANVKILEGMALQMESETLTYPDKDEILRELRGLEEDPLTGKIAAADSFDDGDEESELHDDIPRAIALAVHAYDNRPRSGAIDLSKIRAGES